MDHPVRVRFAPSPTGPLHIGGVRTALFNWLYARHTGGKFILRIEDTDQARYVPGSIELITDGLRWLGLDWDEGPEVGGEYGPYIQSERTALYRQWADWLVDQGKAYRCYCTSERLDNLRKSGVQGYDLHCRTLSTEDRAAHEANGDSYVIRFKMPLDGQTTVHDLIRGDITVENSTLTDLVLLKSDGFPTYHLANVVDDHFMEISHILRAEEWIPTAPVHRQLYDAFGWEMPAIAHLPVILNPNGRGKLSKRTVGFTEDGRSVPVRLNEFREAGYLPEAIVNFLTNIGWSFGEDREVFSVAETIERFDLSRINPAGGKFPLEKLDWLNGVYVREMATDKLVALLGERLAAAGYRVDQAKLVELLPLIRPRVQRLDDVIEKAGFFFVDAVHPTLNDLIQKQMDAADTQRALQEAYDLVAGTDDFSAEGLEVALRTLSDELGLKTSQFFGLLRVALTAQQVAPPLFETMVILGREACLARIQAAQALLVDTPV